MEKFEIKDVFIHKACEDYPFREVMLRMEYLFNEDFNRFVNANAKAYGRTVSFELSTKTTWHYFLSLQKGGCNESKSND